MSECCNLLMLECQSNRKYIERLNSEIEKLETMLFTKIDLSEQIKNDPKHINHMKHENEKRLKCECGLIFYKDDKEVRYVKDKHYLHIL